MALDQKNNANDFWHEKKREKKKLSTYDNPKTSKKRTEGI